MCLKPYMWIFTLVSSTMADNCNNTMLIYFLFTSLENFKLLHYKVFSTNQALFKF
jgi:hypothetical protein